MCSQEGSGIGNIIDRKVSSCSNASNSEVEVVVYNENGLSVAPDNMESDPDRLEVKRDARNVTSLGEKVARTSQFLRELQTLSSSLQEQPMTEEDEEVKKDRKVRDGRSSSFHGPTIICFFPGIFKAYRPSLRGAPRWKRHRHESLQGTLFDPAVAAAARHRRIIGRPQ